MHIQLIRTSVILTLLVNFSAHSQTTSLIDSVGNTVKTRHLSSVNPISTTVTAETAGRPLTPIKAPLSFESASIRAFEPSTFSVPSQQTLSLTPPTGFAELIKTGAEEQPTQILGISRSMQNPLEFISPSIRAFPIITSMTQEQRLSPFNYGFSGYIKNESFIDSYQVLGEAQDQYLLVPLSPVPDRCGDNINARGRYNMLAIESRVRGEIAGPCIFGSNSFGVVEIDAWASCVLQIGLLRMRHAFIYLEWEDKSLMFGQYWHPVILPECYADTISFNGGTPFEPFSREPQVRLTKQFDTMTLLLAAGSHANSPYDDPYGLDTLYARNGIMPNINIQLFSSIREHLCGIGVDVTRLVPRLVTNKNFCAHESLMSWLVIAFASFNWERLGLRLKFIYGQNGDSYGLISGYAVHSIDPYTDKRSYTNTQCLNAWLDTAYKGEVEPGLFLGVSKNIGALRSIIPSIIDPETGQKENLIYSSGLQNIDVLFRVQPRIRWFLKPFVFGAELELTGAKYGAVTDTARVINTQLVNNLRVLLAAFYVF